VHNKQLKYLETGFL